MTLSFRSLVRENVITRNVARAMMRGWGRYYSKTGRLYPALDALCRAYRLVPEQPPHSPCERAVHDLMHKACFSNKSMLPIAGNRFLAEFPRTRAATRIREEHTLRPLPDRVRLRQPKTGQDPRREGSLIVLKQPDLSTGERGVILLKYLYSFAEMPAIFDMVQLAERYQFVLEPSWTGYVEAPFFLYIGSDVDVVIQCTQPYDARFFDSLGVNFRTVQMGGGDWVDYDLFAHDPAVEREFDLAMVASWVPWKRHDALFQALARLKPRKFRVALIGAGSPEGRAELEQQMERMAVADQCRIFEKIPAPEVASLLARSKVALLLSKLEGTNKGIHEALFCDTPIIVYRHHVGLDMTTVNEMTGVLADDQELPEAIVHMVENYRDFRPREWALANTGFRRSTDIVNSVLREMTLARNRPWTRDIAYKVNRPHAQYKFDDDRERLASEYDRLAGWLLPTTDGTAR
jgi:glycosyltransferase involved in cell wall biosynthesis